MEKKKIKISSNNDKCENCGAEIKYDPISQNLKCDNCGQLKNFEKLKDIEVHDINKKTESNAHREWLDNNKSFQCQNCGAKVVIKKSAFSIICPYCGSHYVSEIDELPGAKPDAIIPFTFNETLAGEQFKKTVKKKFFVPRNFKKNLPTNKIRGVYIPAFSFNADSNSTYNGKLERGSGDDSYSYLINGSNSFNHKDVLVEASSNISDYDLTKILPYQFSDAYKYNHNFIKGYSVEHYHEVMEHCINIAHNKMEKEIEKDILKEYSYSRVDYLNIDATYSNEKYSYYLLPVYNLEYTYKNRKYITHMNGQTGRIGGNLPISGWKIAFVVGLGLLAFGFVAYQIYKFVIGM